MKILVSLWLMLMVITAGTVAIAGPGKPFTGKITYGIKINGDVPPEAAGMMPTQATYTIGDDLMRVDVQPSTMGAGPIFMNHKDKTMRMLFDIPGTKIQMILDEEYKQQLAKVNDVKYVDETRKIAGYDCKKAIVKNADGEETTVWYTDKIEVKSSSAMWGNLKGFPLEFTNSGQGREMIYTATNVAPGKVNKKDFEIPADYKPMTQEELMQMFQGMQE